MLRQINDWKVKLILSKNLQSEILFHHTQYKKEWCGILLFKESSGSIQEKNLEIFADKMYLLQLGSEAYVGGENGDMYLDAMDDIPDFMDYKCGFLHSHHSMQTFFSGTDTQELEDQASNHAYFVSLIVNHSCEYTAKVSFVGESESSDFKYKTRFGDYVVPITKNVVFSIDCSLFMEVEENTKKRMENLKEKSTLHSMVQPYPTGTSLGVSGMYKNGYGSYNNYSGEYSKETSFNLQGRQKELYPVKTARYILNEILTNSDINIPKFKLNNGNLGNILENYEKLDETMLSEVEMEIWNNMDEIIMENNHWGRFDDNLETKMCDVYAECANYLINNYVGKINKINGFTEKLIQIFIEAIQNCFEDERTFLAYINEKNLFEYAS